MCITGQKIVGLCIKNHSRMFVSTKTLYFICVFYQTLPISRPLISLLSSSAISGMICFYGHRFFKR
jgi:hypothetical protein